MQTFPNRQSNAVVAAVTFNRIVVEAGDRRNTSLGKAKNIAHGVFFRGLSQLIAALITSVSVKDIRFVQNGDNLLKIFFLNILPRGNVL